MKKLLKTHLLLSGKVQGVGFRYHTRVQAHRNEITGWVRNLPDGRVEIEVFGEKERLTLFLKWCERGPEGAMVTNVERVSQTEIETSPFPSFEITPTPR